MNFNRLNSKVFKWSNLYGFKRMCFRVCNQFQSICFNEYLNTDIFPSKSIINMIEDVLFENFKHDLYVKLLSDKQVKLRFYKIFKFDFCTENFLNCKMPGKYRSAFSKFRCGVAQLRVETGRYERSAVEDRVCFNCNNILEDEKHVLLECPLYDSFRQTLFLKARSFDNNFLSRTDQEKVRFLFTNESLFYYTAKTCYDILMKRKCVLYKSLN